LFHRDLTSTLATSTLYMKKAKALEEKAVDRLASLKYAEF
jgi:hypothetical protein